MGQSSSSTKRTSTSRTKESRKVVSEKKRANAPKNNAIGSDGSSSMCTNSRCSQSEYRKKVQSQNIKKTRCKGRKNRETKHRQDSKAFGALREASSFNKNSICNQSTQDDDLFGNKVGDYICGEAQICARSSCCRCISSCDPADLQQSEQVDNNLIRNKAPIACSTCCLTDKSGDNGTFVSDCDRNYPGLLTKANKICADCLLFVEESNFSSQIGKFENGDDDRLARLKCCSCCCRGCGCCLDAAGEVCDRNPSAGDANHQHCDRYEKLLSHNSLKFTSTVNESPQQQHQQQYQLHQQQQQSLQRQQQPPPPQAAGKCHKRNSKPQLSTYVEVCSTAGITYTCCHKSEAQAQGTEELGVSSTASLAFAHVHGNELETSSSTLEIDTNQKSTFSGKIEEERSGSIDCYLKQARQREIRGKQDMDEDGERIGVVEKTLNGEEERSKVSLASDNSQVKNDIQHVHNNNWKLLAQRYGCQMAQVKTAPLFPSPFRLSRMRKSCFCHLFASTLFYLLPIFNSFKSYKLPADIVTDLTTGFTIAVLQIPQGMAYGLLANVEPIYGLYVSFVPVVVMSMMSKSRHVSYGTFAIISILLANATESIKSSINNQAIKDAAQQHQNVISEPAVSPATSSELGALTITDNHQPLDDSQKLVRNLLIKQQPNVGDQPVVMITRNSTQGYAAGLPAADSHIVDIILPENIEILTCICLVVGIIQIVMALARLGILSHLFSDQLVSSFTAASAIHVMTSQIGGLFDSPLPKVSDGFFKLYRVWFAFVDRLYHEGCNQYTGVMSMMSLVFLLTIKEVVEPSLRRHNKSFSCLPSELVLMVVLISSSWYWDFAENYGILIVGPVPTGLPAPEVPRLNLVPWVIQDSMTIALVSFAMNLSLGQVYAKKYKYVLDPNAELFALGTSNLVGSFYQCFPCASSLSRSAVLSNLDAKSQLCSLFSCALVASILCYFAPVLYDLPRSTLSCIIIVALKGILMQIRDLAENWRLSKLDAAVWIITFVAVLEFGVIYGLLIGVATSFLVVVIRLLLPNYSILGQLPGTDIYVDKNLFVECCEIEGCKIFKFNSALCYLTRTILKSKITKSLKDEKDPHDTLFEFQHRSRETKIDNIKYLVIDCSALAFCDYAGAGTLVEIIEELKERNIYVCLAACPMSLIRMIEKMKKNSILEENVYPTIRDAINQVIKLKSQTSNSLSPDDLKLPDNFPDDTSLKSVLTSQP